MGAVLRFLFEMMLTFVVAWVLIFGGNGALLSRARGASPVIGFIWGALLGPLGWCAIWWRTRSGNAIDADDWIDGPMAFTPITSAGLDEQESRGMGF